MKDLNKQLIYKYAEKLELKEKKKNSSYFAILASPILGGLLSVGVIAALTVASVSFSAIHVGLIIIGLSPIAAAFCSYKANFGKINKEIRLLEKQVKAKKHFSNQQQILLNFETKKEKVYVEKQKGYSQNKQSKCLKEQADREF